MPGPRRGRQAHGISGRREGARHDLEDGLQHRLRPVPGRSGWSPDRPPCAAVPVAGRQAGDRLARGAGAQPAALPDAAVESAPVRDARRGFAPAVLAALVWAITPVAEAQSPIRIGTAVPQTGNNLLAGQNLLRGYQLCVKHTNEKGGVLGRMVELLAYDNGSDAASA